MKTIIINGVYYNPRQVVSCETNENTVLIRFVDGKGYKLKMDSMDEAISFINDLIGSW